MKWRFLEERFFLAEINRKWLMNKKREQMSIQTLITYDFMRKKWIKLPRSHEYSGKHPAGEFPQLDRVKQSKFQSLEFERMFEDL